MGIRILNKPLEAYSMYISDQTNRNDIYINQNDFDSYRGIEYTGLETQYNTDIYNQCDSVIYYKFILSYDDDDPSKIFEGFLHAGEHIHLPTYGGSSLSGKIYFRLTPAAIYKD